MSLTDPRRVRAAALLAGGAAAGVIGAWALSSNAQATSTSPTAPTSSTAPATSSTATGASNPGQDRDHRGGPGGHNPDENSVTSAQASTLKAAALQHVSGGTVGRVETDSGDAAFEVHMTDANGKQVTVKFDKDLTFVAVEDGMGK